jgi:nucleotide-binding universal stress UspA family protein
VQIKKILVPVTGNSADDEVIELSCKLAARSKAKVYVVYVIEVERSLPLDSPTEAELEKAERILTHAEEVATNVGYEIETDLLTAREAGPGIVREAVERGVDLIVMGMGYKVRFGKFDLGETVPYVLKESPCQVLVYRRPIS